MKNDKSKKNLDKKLDAFLEGQEMDCTGDECIIKTDKSIVERINKKIITDDGSGRELLM
jgi:hypothetical protein